MTRRTRLTELNLKMTGLNVMLNLGSEAVSMSFGLAGLAEG